MIKITAGIYKNKKLETIDTNNLPPYTTIDDLVNDYDYGGS